MTRIYDSIFAGQDCLHASGQTIGRMPLHIKWRRWGMPGKVSWFTDADLHRADELITEYSTAAIGWILEPFELHQEPYEKIVQMGDVFERIVTHDDALLEFFPSEKVIIAPSGGTRLHTSDWRIPALKEKPFTTSLVLSDKRTTEGHKMRRVISETAMDSIARLGGSEYVDKREGVVPFKFTVAIESSRRKHWFTEQLIDPLLAGCVPIYWGCHDLERYGFNTSGIVQCDSLEAVMDAIEAVSAGWYEDLHNSGVLAHNLVAALQYTMTEDYLFREHPELFDEYDAPENAHNNDGSEGDE